MKLTAKREKSLRAALGRESHFYWIDYLQNVYDSFEEFEAYSDIYSVARRAGFDDNESAWEANPILSSSTRPEDFCNVLPRVQELKLQERRDRLMPNGVPRYIRVFDNGGMDNPNGKGSADRYTAVFTGRFEPFEQHQWDAHGNRLFHCRAMSSEPYHPQGIGLFVYCVPGGHLGKRIKFEDLPKDCKDLVLFDYKEIWKLENEEPQCTN